MATLIVAIPTVSACQALSTELFLVFRKKANGIGY